jgi:ribosomal-protein-alanine N-acetyltransferase
VVIISLPFPNLSTNRLSLRKLVIDDKQELMRLRSDERVNKYLDRAPTKSLQETEAYIHKINKILTDKEGAYWAISLKNEDKLIGTICYWNFEPDKDLAEIGYELSPAYQGQGLMQEAVEKVIEYGFKAMQLKIITGLTDVANERSVSLLKKNNFQYDSDYRFVNKEDADGLAVYFLINDGKP